MDYNRDINFDLITVPNVNGTVIMNVTGRKYGMAVRNGDMLGFCNIVEHLRQRENRQDIKIHIEENTLFRADFRFQFRDFLYEHTDYLSRERGGVILPKYCVWDYRKKAGDYVKIKNPYPQKKKICITPVFDAGYNEFRNWSIENTQNLIDRYSKSHFKDHEKVFCSIMAPSEINYRGFIISSDFRENLRHIMEAETYIGGDTGTSHFAGSLDPAPRELIYYLHKQNHRLGEIPFHFQTKGTVLYY